VLDNDSDDNDSLSELEITDSGSPSKGSTNILEHENFSYSHDWIRYTPISTETNYDYSFTYTVEDTDGESSTATVSGTVDNTGCGSVTIEVEDPDGNPKNADNLGFEFDNNSYSVSGQSSYTLDNISLTDMPKDARVQKSDINPPSGYEIPSNNWILKSFTGSDDGHPGDPTRSDLAF
jgi:hypothetical protein